jgi:hypothetical protein
MKDRNGIILAPGQHVRIQVCTGRYGQVEIREGTITRLGAYYVIMRTHGDFVENMGRFGMHLRRAGTEVSVNVPRDGYEKFSDFEHGHETWVEVIP